MYLIKRGVRPGKKWIAHVWLGTDTACRMWSTGGIKNKHKYLHASYPLHISPSGEKTELPLCHMCVQNLATGEAVVPRGRVPLPEINQPSNLPLFE